MDLVSPLSDQEVELIQCFRMSDEIHKSLILTSAEVAKEYAIKKANHKAEVYQFPMTRN